MWRLMTVTLVLGLTGACAGGDDDEAAPSAPSLAATAPATEPVASSPVSEAGGSTAPPATTATTTTTGAAVVTNEPTTVAPAVTSAPTVPASEPASSSAPVVDSTCAELDPGVHEFSFSGGGADHAVRVFVPSARPEGLVPTVLNWHGLGSNGPDQANFTGYEALAEAEGFIVVHPTGVAGPRDPGNSWELSDLQDPARDDIAFAGALIDELIANWCADPTRIYSTGMSNGGFFTARLVCEMADRIAAASSVAGTYHPDGCAPARPVPYLAFHGTADLVVPFDGSGESVLNPGNDPTLQAFFEQVMPEEFAEFAADDGCAPGPPGTPVGEDVIRYDYAGCVGGTPLTFFEITGGGHTWPGSPIAALVASSLGYTTDDVDATADSWAFFEQQRLGS
jgi:polyhydroxybutyrate depolymerase